MKSTNPFIQLDQNGLHLQYVINIEKLDKTIYSKINEHLDKDTNYNQLIVLANAGKTFWDNFLRYKPKSTDPIDEYSIEIIRNYFTKEHPHINFKIIYPGPSIIPLQKIGAMAGWHNPSPFMVGINRNWGSWFAYRVVLLSKSSFQENSPMTNPSPCDSCEEKACINSCPANALSNLGLNLEKCSEYRIKKNSICRDQCYARIKCPVGNQHRYKKEQIQYHYRRSLNTIKKMKLQQT